MFCEKCGTQLPDGAGFCNVCGTPVISQVEPEVAPDVTSEVIPEVTPEVAPDIVPQVVPEIAPQPYSSEQTYDTGSVETQKKPKGKKVAIISIAIVLVVALLAGVAGIIGSSILSSPFVALAAALEKTVFESQSLSFEVEMDYGEWGEESASGAIYLGTDVDSSKFLIETEYDDIGLVDGKIYTMFGEESLDDTFDEIDDTFDEYYDIEIDSKAIIDDVIENKIQLSVIESYATGELADEIKKLAEEEMDVDVEVDSEKGDEVLALVKKFYKKHLTEEALSIEKERVSGQKVYKFEIDTYELCVCLVEFLENDETANKYYKDYLDQLDIDEDDIEDLLDDIKDEDITIDGEYIIDKKGYLTYFEIDIEDEVEIRVTISDINSAEVDEEKIKDIPMSEEELDEYYNDLYSDYYGDEYYYDDEYYGDEYYYDDEYYGDAYYDNEYYF